MGAKKKPQKGVMVRLPEVYRAPLEELRRRSRRPIVTEVQIALEKHFESEGVKFERPDD